MSQTLHPRPCGPQAWRRWARQGAQVAGRGWALWAPLTVLVSLAWMRGAWENGWWLLAVAAFSPWWWAAQVAFAELLAEGRLSLASQARAVMGQVWAQRGVLARSSALRMGVGMGLMTGMGLWWLSHDPTAAQSVERTPWSVWAGARLWATCWLCSQSFRAGSSVSFWPWTRWQMGLPVRACFALESDARQANAVSLGALMVLWVVGVLVLMLCPVLVWPMEVWWASMLTCAWRDIFDHKSRLAAMEAPAAASAPVAHWQPGA